MSKGLREIAAPKVVARPSGVRIRTRLRVSEQDLDVLLQVGVHLGKLAGQDLAARIRLGATKEDQRAARKQALTDASSSRWAGAITRTSNDQWQLSWRGLRTHRTDLEQAIATIERRIGVPVGERTGKTRGYGSQRERYMKQQRLQVLTARLEKVEAQIDAGRVHVVRGGRRLMKKLQHLIVQLADARAKATAEPKDTGLAQAAHRAEAELAAWKRSWIAERLFITADGEGGKRYGNESVHVDPVRQVVSLRLPTPLKDLANAKHGRYEIPLVKLFAQHTDEWRGRALSSQAVRYDISYDPVKNRVYIDASWKRTHVPAAPSLDAAVRDGLLAVDTNDGHLAARVLDQHGNPVGPAYTLRLDLDGLPASRRDGRVRAAISRLIALAKDAGVKAIAIEDLNFADARATGRETMAAATRASASAAPWPGSRRRSSATAWLRWCHAPGSRSSRSTRRTPASGANSTG